MSNLHEISRTLKLYKNKKKINLLHCVSNYPVTDKEANLISIRYLKDKFKINIGYSDHTIGIEASIMAATYGAQIIEKHFTIDKNYSNFRDHKLSADPSELRALVQAIADVEKFVGKTDNAAAHCEKQNVTAVGRSIASNRDIRIGETISITDICWIRPRKGLKPGEEHLIIGKKLSSPIYEGEFFSLKHFD